MTWSLFMNDPGPEGGVLISVYIEDFYFNDEES